MRAGRDLFQVSAADAASVNPHQQFARPNLRDRNSLYADIVTAVIHDRLHLAGQSRSIRLSFELGSHLHSYNASTRTMFRRLVFWIEPSLSSVSRALLRAWAARAVLVPNFFTVGHMRGRRAT